METARHQNPQRNRSSLSLGICSESDQAKYHYTRHLRSISVCSSRLEHQLRCRQHCS